MRGHGRQRGLVAVAVAAALVAAGCGGDDAGDSSGSTSPSVTSAPDIATESTAVPTSAAPSTSESGEGSTTSTIGDDGDTPVMGGSVTILRAAEIGSLDPVKMVGTGVGDGQQGNALYGSLLLTNPTTFETEPFMAESFTPSEDAIVWTLKLRPGIVMSDGSSFDAAAVQANWRRGQDIANRSPSFTTLMAISSMDITDPLTLKVTLSAPNAHFDKGIARVGANFIASAQAIAAGTDLTSQAIGAGPYRLKEWLRDDRMVLERNPDWTLTDGPYLDEITFRILPDEDQRIDTFLTGDGDAFWTTTPASAARVVEEVDGAEYVSVNVATGQAIVFNTSKAPFDDVRVRQAVAQAVDWQAMDTSVSGEGAIAPYNFSRVDTPWFDPAATLPPYDLDAAQALIDDYVADLGGGQLEVVYLSQQGALDQARARFIQAAMSQLDNVSWEISAEPGTSVIEQVLGASYQVASWGFPTFDPDPGLYASVHSTSLNNYSKYSNPEVDALLDAGRLGKTFEERKAAYDQVWQILARDVPYYPYQNATFGWIVSPDLHGAALSLDGTIRFDQLWKS